MVVDNKLDHRRVASDDFLELHESSVPTVNICWSYLCDLLFNFERESPTEELQQQVRLSCIAAVSISIKSASLRSTWHSCTRSG